MMADKWLKQTKAASHIRELLQQRRFDIPSRSIGIEDNQRWVIFEHKGKQVGIDSASGVWIRTSELEDWRCVSMPCTVSGAIQAVDFLTKD